MKDIAFTNEQANFLFTLTKFVIDKTSLRSSCATSQQFELKTFDYTICIVDSTAVDLDVIKKPRAISPTTSTITADSSDGITIPPDTPIVTDVPVIPGANSSPPSKTPSSSSTTDTIDTTSTNKKASSNMLSTTIGCGTGGLVLVLVIVFCLCKTRKRKGKQTTESIMVSTTAGESTFNGVSTPMPIPAPAYTPAPAPAYPTQAISLWNDPDLLSLKVSVDDIKGVKKIGSGAFANVWLVQFHNL